MTHKALSRNTASLKNLDQVMYQAVVENRLSLLPPPIEADEQVTIGTTNITDILSKAFFSQGKSVAKNKHKQKSLWNKDL